MKAINPTARRWLLSWVALGAPLAALYGQSSVSPAPDVEQLPPGLRDLGPKTASKPPRPAGSFFSAGPISFHPHVSFSSVYGLGLPSRDGRRVASMIYTTAPGMRVDLGSQWSLDYLPTWVAYTARAMEDTFNQAVSLQGFGRVEEWSVQFSENYTERSDILFETGRQTETTTWATQLGLSRAITNKLSFSTSLVLDERYGETTPDIRDWSATNWLNLTPSNQFQAGLGFGAGYSDIVARPDGTRERYLARFSWKPTDKLTLSVDGGVESRHSRASASKDLRSPILNGALVYRPFATTSLTFSAAETVSNSYFDNQVTKGSSWSVALNQRLLQHFYLTCAYGHQQSEFEATTTLVPVITLPTDPAADPSTDLLPVSLPGRKDSIDSFSARVSTLLLKRITVAVTGSRNRNHSSQTGFSFTTTQYGLEISCRY